MLRSAFGYIMTVFRWIRNHKYIFVTLVFFAIIFLLDDNNLMGHMKNRSVINKLSSEIKEMEADSANLEMKLKLYSDGNPEVIENVARENGLFKENEDVYIIKKR